MTIAPIGVSAPTFVVPNSGPKPDLTPAVALRLMPSAAAAPGHAATTEALRGRILIIPIGTRSQMPGLFGSGGDFPESGSGRTFTLPRGMGRPGWMGGGNDGNDGGMSQAPEPTPRQPLPGERQAYETNIRRVQDFWGKLGVGPDEGNGRELPVEFLSNYPNASYAHSEDGSQESFNIGLDRTSGKSYATATDVIAHEYAHRVVNHILGQQGEGEAGAVN